MVLGLCTKNQFWDDFLFSALQKLLSGWLRQAAVVGPP